MSERQQQEQLELAPETEANELKQLRLSATFLTPFAVAPTQDNRVWLSNNHQTYIDVSPNKQGDEHTQYMWLAAEASSCVVALTQLTTVESFTSSIGVRHLNGTNQSKPQTPACTVSSRRVARYSLVMQRTEAA